MRERHEGQGEVGFGIFAVIVVILIVVCGGYWLTGWETVDAGNVGIVVNYQQGTATCPVDKPTCADNEKIRAARVTPHYPGSWFWASPRVERFYQYPVSEQTTSFIRNTTDNNGGVTIQDKGTSTLYVDAQLYWSIDQTNIDKLFRLRPNLTLNDNTSNDIESTIVQREFLSAVQVAAASYRYDEIVANKEKYSADVEKLVRTNLGGTYLIVNRVVIGTVHPNTQQQNAINARADADAAVTRAGLLEQQRKNEANAAVAVAEGNRLIGEKNAQTEAANKIIVAEADRQVAEKNAQAQATNTKITSEAEAARIKAINAALANSPQYLAWRAIEKWNGVGPTTLVTGDAGTFHVTYPIP